MTKTLPLVSIILPTYNGSQFIRESIESCLGQTYREIELVIVDDASSDSTPEIIAQYAQKDPRVKVFRHAVNQKLPAALNTGFRQAQGAYFTWTSDDNIFRPDAIEYLVSRLKILAKDSIVYSDYIRIDDSGKELDQIRAEPRESIVFRNCVGPCFLYSKHIYETLNGFAEDLFLAEDYDFWLRAAALFNFRPCHENLYFYRKHAGSLSFQRQTEIRRATAAALERNLPQLGWLSKPDRAKAYLRLAIIYQTLGQKAKIFHSFKPILSNQPFLFFSARALGLWAYLLLGNKIFSSLRRIYSGKTA